MKQQVARVLAFAVGLTTLGSALADDIRYSDSANKGKEVRLSNGTINSESPTAIVFTPDRGAKLTIPAMDVIDVKYTIRGEKNIAYNRALEQEDLAEKESAKPADRRAAYEKAIDLYKKFIPEIAKEKNAKDIQRQVEWKIARLTVRLAEFDKQPPRAGMELLAKFKADYPDSWQIGHCYQLLAYLEESQEDYNAAIKTYEEWAKNDKFPKEIRQNCEAKITDLLIRAKRHNEAERRLIELLKKLPENDPASFGYRVELAKCMAANKKMDEAQKQIDEIIHKATDKDVIARAFNAKGDCYLEFGGNDKYRQAMWEYLMVDRCYRQNKEEHAKALYNLYRCFTAMKDAKKAEICKKELQEDPKFEGSTWRSKLAAEK
jgi:tetratricopeptide (TPR) repeat protein